MMRSAILAVTGIVSVSLGGCLTIASNIPVWEHFDACPDQSTFHKWVTCAKARRQAACDASRCSSSSSNVVAYVDNLDQAVERGQVTEADARRKWLQYRQEHEVRSDSRDRIAFDKAVGATGAPVYCTSGKSMGC
jgi:hypothetical protein